MKRLMLGIGLLTLIVVLGVFLVRFAGSNLGGSRNSADFPEGTFWLCRENAHRFNLSIAELGKWYEAHPGEPPPCPECDSQDTVRVEKGSTNVTGVSERYSD